MLVWLLSGSAICMHMMEPGTVPCISQTAHFSPRGCTLHTLGFAASGAYLILGKIQDTHLQRSDHSLRTVGDPEL